MSTSNVMLNKLDASIIPLDANVNENIISCNVKGRNNYNNNLDSKKRVHERTVNNQCHQLQLEGYLQQQQQSPHSADKGGYHKHENFAYYNEAQNCYNENTGEENIFDNNSTKDVSHGVSLAPESTIEEFETSPGTSSSKRRKYKRQESSSLLLHQENISIDRNDIIISNCNKNHPETIFESEKNGGGFSEQHNQTLAIEDAEDNGYDNYANKKIEQYDGKSDFFHTEDVNNNIVFNQKDESIQIASTIKHSNLVGDRRYDDTDNDEYMEVVYPSQQQNQQYDDMFTGGWVFNKQNRQQQHQPERWLVSSSSSSLSIVSSTASIQTIQSSSESSVSMLPYEENTKTNSFRTTNMANSRSSDVLRIDDELDKLIQRTEDWSLFHVRNLRSKESLQDLQRLSNASFSANSCPDATDTTAEYNSNVYTNPSNTIPNPQAASIMQDRTTDSRLLLATSLSSSRTKDQVHTARKNVIRTLIRKTS